MKGVLINPENQSVREVEWDGDYTSIAPLLGCAIYTVVQLQDGVDLFIDDEGLLTNPNPHGYFRFDNGRVRTQVYAGRGLLLGNNGRGDNISLPLGVPLVKANTVFVESPSPEEIEPRMEVHAIGDDESFEDAMRRLTGEQS